MLIFTPLSWSFIRQGRSFQNSSKHWDSINALASGSFSSRKQWIFSATPFSLNSFKHNINLIPFDLDALWSWNSKRQILLGLKSHKKFFISFCWSLKLCSFVSKIPYLIFFSWKNQIFLNTHFKKEKKTNEDFTIRRVVFWF